MPLFASRARLTITNKPADVPPMKTPKKTASVKSLMLHTYRAKAKEPSNKAQGIFSPSQLTKCRRRQQFNLLFVKRAEAPTTPQLQRIFENGHNREYGLRNALAAAAKANGIEWMPSVKMRIEKYLIAGELDGILKYPNGDRWVVDFKTINDARFKALQAPSEEYVWQFHPYMLGTGISRTICYYENKNNQADEEFVVKFDEKLWQHILDHTILYILKATARGKLVPPDADKCDARECPYASVCFSNPVFDEIDRRPQAVKHRLKVILE